MSMAYDPRYWYDPDDGPPTQADLDTERVVEMDEDLYERGAFGYEDPE